MSSPGNVAVQVAPVEERPSNLCPRDCCRTCDWSSEDGKVCRQYAQYYNRALYQKTGGVTSHTFGVCSEHYQKYIGPKHGEVYPPVREYQGRDDCKVCSDTADFVVQDFSSESRRVCNVHSISVPLNFTKHKYKDANDVGID